MDVGNSKNYLGIMSNILGNMSPDIKHFQEYFPIVPEHVDFGNRAGSTHQVEVM